MNIIKAEYGIGLKNIDVTALIKNKINCNELPLHITNITMGGDPFYKKRKYLTIRYNDGSIQKYRENEYFILNNKSTTTIPEFGFIITRHIRDMVHNYLWMEAYKCIRLHYNEPIIIIDDNSSIENTNNTELINNIELINTTIIKSEYPGCGELLPYYYFNKLMPFKKAVILHDSMFIKEYINFNEIKTPKFIWHFDYHQWDDQRTEKKFINILDNNVELLRFYNSKMWFGCFGAAMIINFEFANLLETKYKISRLLTVIKTRNDRMSFERIIGVLCFFEDKVKSHDCSLMGSINNHLLSFRFSFYNYKTTAAPGKIIKVWSGR